MNARKTEEKVKERAGATQNNERLRGGNAEKRRRDRGQKHRRVKYDIEYRGKASTKDEGGQEATTVYG